MKNYKIKLLSVFVVALMMLSGLAVALGPGYDSDATDGELESLYPGSWTWDTTTGVGPFNSFYAAFDIENDNAFVSVLDPNNLKNTINGTPLDVNGRYNIMWVIPTTYWTGQSDYNIVVTTDSSSGYAYAHEVDGHTYNYLAIGVYEASTATIDGQTVLTSESGATPLTNETRPTIRTYAHNYTMDADSLGSNAKSMLWNFYQWELFKNLSLVVTEDFNSQAVVGNGYTYGNTSVHQTGATDSLGPYAGKIGTITSNGDSPVKLFIENAWGGIDEFIDGALKDGTTLWLDSTSNPTDSKTASTYVLDYTVPSLVLGHFATSIYTSLTPLWGIGYDGIGTATTGLADRVYDTPNYPDSLVSVGGDSSTDDGEAEGYGLNYMMMIRAAETFKSASTGSRLAFVFDNIPDAPNNSGFSYTLVYDPSLMTTTSAALSVANKDPITHNPLTTTVTFEVENTGIDPGSDPYGTVTPSQVSDVIVGSTISVYGNTLTVGGVTVTAEPNPSSAQYEYHLINGWWYDSTTEVRSGDLVTEDMNIISYFSRAVRNYTITWSINGIETTDSYEYGDTPYHADPVIEGYIFEGWDPAITAVTQDQTYTAILTPIVPVLYTVTWNANGGDVSPSSSTGNTNNPIASGPTPTRAWYTFDGWFTEAEGGTQVTFPYGPYADVTFYAHWTPILFTVTLDANGGTPATQTVTGSPTVPATLPEATYDSMYILGWFTAATGGDLVGFPGTVIYPSEDTTLFAQWSDVPVYTYTVEFNLTGGYNGPDPLVATSTEEGTHTFTIPRIEPKKDGGWNFKGWALTEGGQVEYAAGDEITVQSNETIMLYAVWGEKSPSGFDWLRTAIPVIVVIGLIIGSVSIIFTSHNVNEMIRLFIGLVVGVLLLALLLLPILDGL